MTQEKASVRNALNCDAMYAVVAEEMDAFE
jgi:hypothetical protein